MPSEFSTVCENSQVWNTKEKLRQEWNSFLGQEVKYNFHLIKRENACKLSRSARTEVCRALLCCHYEAVLLTYLHSPAVAPLRCGTASCTSVAQNLHISWPWERCTYRTPTSCASVSSSSGLYQLTRCCRLFNNQCFNLMWY